MDAVSFSFVSSRTWPREGKHGVYWKTINCTRWGFWGKSMRIDPIGCGEIWVVIEYTLGCTRKRGGRLCEQSILEALEVSD